MILSLPYLPIYQRNDYFPFGEVIQDETKSSMLLDEMFTVSIYLTSVIKLIIILLYLIGEADVAYKV